MAEENDNLPSWVLTSLHSSLCPHPGGSGRCTTGLLEGWDETGVRACQQRGEVTGKHGDLGCLQGGGGSLVELDLAPSPGPVWGWR